MRRTCGPLAPPARVERRVVVVPLLSLSLPLATLVRGVEDAKEESRRCEDDDVIGPVQRRAEAGQVRARREHAVVRELLRHVGPGASRVGWSGCRRL